MKVQTIRERLLASTMIGGVALLAMAAPAFAQDAQDPDATELDEIVVTGTRIPQANLVTTSPVTQVTGEDIDVQGVTRVEDLVNQLPQAFAAQNSSVSNGASGTATVSLRNLGSSRTLVLIDGHRIGYGSPQDDAADLNQIPGQLVERVEVLTGGASAVYGSDAIAGVVNFIMKRNFEGVGIDAQYGFYQHNNDFDGVGNIRDVIAARGQTNPAQFQLPPDDIEVGASREATIMIGASTPDDRGNVTAYATYRKNNKVLARDYDYGACSIGAPAAATPDSFTCGGSGTNATGNITVLGNGGAFTVDQGTGNFRRNTGNDAYNFGPSNFYQRPDERYSLGAFARYEVNRHAEVYADVMFSDYESVAQVAPGGAFIGDFPPVLNCDNPLLSQQQLDLVCNGDVDPTTPGVQVDPRIANPVAGQSPFLPVVDTDPDTPGNQGVQTVFIGRRNVEGGGRQSVIQLQNYRVLGGLRGEITDGWNYDLSASRSQTRLNRAELNYFGKIKIARALDVVDVNGTPTCRSVVDGSDPACVPYDIFTPGGVTQEALDYLSVAVLLQGVTSEDVITGVITGDLTDYGIASPWAQSGLKLAFGAEFRRNELSNTPDEILAVGGHSGSGGPTQGLEGSNEVKDFFMEAQLPLAEGLPFVDYASVDVAYRYSDYKLGGEADTYKIGFDYAPVPSVRFRTSFQHAVRAPNVIELFTAQGFNLFDLDDDPCDFTDPADNGTYGAACIGTGDHQVTQGEANSGLLTSVAGQYNVNQGGNPGLAPEEADTFTVGVVFQPEFVPGLNVSVDYFDIEVEKLISTVGPLNTIDACYLNGLTSACDLINRDTLTGALWLGNGSVTDLNTNIGGIKTSGVDIVANYGLDLADFGMNWGGLGFNLTGTWVEKLETDNGLGFGNSVIDCVGFYANQCGVPNPEWRHRFRVSYSPPISGFEISGTWRYYGEAEVAVLDPTGATGSLNNGGARIDRFFDEENYFDLAATYQLRDNVRLRAGVNNILDNDPQLSTSVGTTGNGNTYPQLYDSLGRYIFVGISAEF